MQKVVSLEGEEKAALLKSFGIDSGDLDIIRAGEKINLAAIDKFVDGVESSAPSVPETAPTTPGAAPPEPITPACLLYTSPSPRDRTRSRMPSSA